jgi:hypothetical protein
MNVNVLRVVNDRDDLNPSYVFVELYVSYRRFRFH